MLYMQNNKTKYTFSKGLTLVEILIAVFTMVILGLSLANFSSSSFKVSYDQAQQLKNNDQNRFSNSLITSEIQKASYIFPANKNITIYGQDDSIGQSFSNAINTNTAVAILIKNFDNNNYQLKVFYLLTTSGKTNLYEFAAYNDYSWTKNTLPGSNFNNVQGGRSVLLSDINTTSSSLAYVLNSNNGSTDSILKGSIGGVAIDNDYALIKSINWTLSTNNAGNTIIGGVAENVPRYVE